MRAVVGVDGADAFGVGEAPVHAGLLAAAHDEDPRGGLDMAGADEVAVPAEPAVAHVVEALFEVGEFVEGSLGGAEGIPVASCDAPDDAVRAAPVQQALEEAVFLFGHLRRICGCTRAA